LGKINKYNVATAVTICHKSKFCQRQRKGFCGTAGRDIVQLRLQKALAGQKDPQKKARLESALKALASASFGN
jgi:hypothetical protein